MRIVIVGASEIGLSTARHMMEHGHEVVVVDKDRERLDEVGDMLDCGLIVGDGTKPGILKEAMNSSDNVLIAVTDFDQDNILSALIGRSVGFDKVIPQISQTDHRTICDELGLEFAIAPHETIARRLVDLIENRDALRADAALEGDARLFGLVIRKDSAVTALDDIALPEDSRIVCVFRNKTYRLPDRSGALETDDRVLILTNDQGYDALQDTYGVAKAPENRR